MKAFGQTAAILMLLALALGWPAYGEEPGSVRALLVGVDYGLDRPWGPLHGSLDVKNMASALEARGVRDIRSLRGEEATGGAIREALKRIERDARPGDTVVFYYSGHGFVAVDDGTDERAFDGLDECIIPADSPAPEPQGAEYNASVIRDDAIESSLERLVKTVRAGGREGSVVFIFDSCHSGSLSRSANAAGVRRKTAPAALQAFRRYVQRQEQKPQDGFASPHEAGTRGWVVLCAARADQEAIDTAAGGIFTLALIEALQSEELTSYRDLMLQVRNRVNNHEDSLGSQSPTLAGDRALQVLSGARLQAQSEELEVVDTDSDPAERVRLNRGSLSGLYPGTRVALFAPGATSASPLATAVVEDRPENLLQAWARLEHPQPDVGPKLLRATVRVLEQNLGDVRLKLYFAGAQPWPTPALALRQFLVGDQAKLVQEATAADQADYLVWPHDEQGRQGHLYFEGRGTSSGPAGSVAAAVPVDGSSARARLQATVQALARKNLLTRVVSPNRSLIKIDLTPGAFVGESFRPDPDVDLLEPLPSGQQALVTVTNQSKKHLYVTVLGLSSDGAVDVLYPRAMDGEWQATGPGNSVVFALVLGPPTGERGPQTGEYMDGLKVIATEAPVFDPVAINTAGNASVVGKGVPQTSISELFSDMLFPGTGAISRAYRPGAQDAGGFLVLSDVHWYRVKLPSLDTRSPGGAPFPHKRGQPRSLKAGG
ncbi:MAG: caspase family protein [Armatimonadetes bacterium]|nr:caspase family protein [Armatimonadota bacterium]